MPTDEHEVDADGRTAAPGGSALRWALGRRVPLWAALLAVLVVAAPLGALLVVQRMEAVELGPAVGGAAVVDVELRLCNRVVDRHEINPRQAELDLESLLEGEGADEVDVRVRRSDCPEGELPSP